MKSSNAVWNFFSSVKLALFTLGCLAVTSIIGTIIPQNESISFYINKYGQKTAVFFQLLDIVDMYTSWWFLALLGLLAINLIVCSIDRIPHVWQQITKDNLAMPLEHIKKMRLSAHFVSPGEAHEVAANLTDQLRKNGWKTERQEKGSAQLLFSQKTPWSRAGVYIVHLSILVIFAGAIFGQLTGFRGSIMLPELQSSDVAFPYEEAGTIDLGFTIRCDRFDIEFYKNNMPKEYTSKLTVLEGDKIVLQKQIEVNDPLKYQGVTFYQASYQPFRDFVFAISADGRKTATFTGEFQKEVKWPEAKVSFGITNMETIQDKVIRLKIWFNDENGEPSQFWMKTGDQVEVKRDDMTYLFSAKQRYATGLQIAKDPGVWVVYLGFTLLIVGLYMAFFMSHRRLWLIVEGTGKQTAVQLRGSTNKNKAAFDKTFQQLADSLKEVL